MKTTVDVLVGIAEGGRECKIFWMLSSITYRICLALSYIFTGSYYTSICNSALFMDVEVYGIDHLNTL